MTLAAFDPSAQVWSMFGLLLSILQPVFWLALCLGFILAGAHFLTMLATRWGERQVSSKALLFSLAVHLSLGCGLVALIPEYRHRLLQFLDPTPDQPMKITTIIYESEQTTPESVAGNTPVWDRIAETPIEDLQRTEAQFDPPDPVETPAERPEPIPLDTLQSPDIATLPDQPVALPDQQRMAPEAPQETQAAMPLQVERPETVRREDVQIPSVSRERSELALTSPSPESTEREAPRGAVDKLRPEYAPIPDVSSIPLPQQEMAEIQRQDDDEAIRSRQGPAPSTLPVEQIGTDELRPEARGETSPPTSAQFTRSLPRTPESSNDSLPIRERPTTLPQTTRPLDERPLAALDGMRSDDSRPRDLPNVQQPAFDPLRRDEQMQVPATYQLRTTEERKNATRQYGGTEESEQAVELALKWLSSTQHPDGYWDASQQGAGSAPDRQDDRDRPNAGSDADTGVTALAVLAFLGAGHTHVQGEYADVVDRALRRLVRQQGLGGSRTTIVQRWLATQSASDGYLGGQADYISGMYCHGMASFALAEAYAMETDPEGRRWLRAPLQRAIDFIVGQQLADGSWRYIVANEYGDMSMFGWQFMALKSAETGGIRIPDASKVRLINFLKSQSKGRSGGLASYRSFDEPTPTMTAEALFCKQMLGLDRESASSREAVAYLLQNLPHRERMNYYFWYYGTLATFQYGGDPWNQWNSTLRDLLVSEQLQRGAFAGSWEPRGEWGPYGGRIYTTAIATLCLEVYYRYLPLYKSEGRYGATP